MINPPRRIELLAPARTAEIGHAAILHGADAVYIGGPAFGARHNAGNAMGEIARLVDHAHRFHARIYVTLNTILADSELEPARRLIQDCYDAGVDALIVQDMGILELDLPPIDLHASTQCDIRTPAKARFLAAAGFSQLVLARELSLKDIAAVRAAVPDDIVIEHFVHGALCVAFSGQCYISHAQTGRSANRGDCSQACRLPYTLQDKEGRVVAFEKHLLSLKDNDQSANLAALIDAGVQSFKIEGRYKDAAYVKNITGHYRQLLDKLFGARPELAPASSGRTQLLFTPNPDKTFHRGATDYFTHGRQADPQHIGAFDSPGYVGLPLGEVTKTGTDFFDITASEPLANGDGLTWLNKRTVVGVQANRVEQVAASNWRIWPNEALANLPGLRAGTLISRNRDHTWEQALTKESAKRRIPLTALFAETDDGFALTLRDGDGSHATAAIASTKQPARQAEEAAANLRTQLGRLGNTDFVLDELSIDCRQPWFVPNSTLNQLRRDAVAQLEAARLAAYTRILRRPAGLPPTPYPETSLSYLANVFNQAARTFYAKHGVQLIEAAYETHEARGEVSLMITKHCLRHAFNLCPHQAKGVTGVQGQVRAEPMTLVNGTERLTLRFDCKACEMHVVGRIKKHVLASPAENLAPSPQPPPGRG
ncbi:MAG: U32 family peptidase [Rhodocyclaceae bacterium]|nr:U32 family peptidase [Rhodocyclaceae bacterium]